MKVLQVLPTLSAGGAEGFVTNLGVRLAASGTEVKFFLLAGTRGERGQVLLQRLRQAGIEVEGQGERNIRNPMTVLRLAGLIHSWKPDIVQANLYSAEVVTVLSRFFCPGARAHFVRRLANSDFVGGRTQAVVRLLDEFFSQTIACSAEVEIAFEKFMKGVAHDTPVTIPNGGNLKDRTTTAEQRREARKVLQIPASSRVIAHIGRMTSGGDRQRRDLSTGQKAHDTLIKAFALAFAGKSDFVLTLVGDGPLRSETERLTRALGVTKQVHFLGEQPEPWPVLQAADLFFFPSRFEGLPNVLPEAASCGLPVLASDIPEIRSISPGDAWLLKPVDDVDAFAAGLNMIVDHYDLFWARAKQAAPRIRESFSMESCAEKFLMTYQNVMNRKLA